ncbi:MAG: SDR family oxidoreductase [Anaerolineales bacterium]|nr:SDR family oxidoreductase [Chloroflexota bacterium]MBL6980498.1 SDR family oxidoreductase [Anaerolineales bacterium]
MIEKQTVLITGATSGIGAAYARRLAEDGFNLIITGRREAKIQALADELSQTHGCEVEVVILELSNPKEVDDLVESIKDRSINMLINNAGFGTTKFFHEESLEIQEKMVSAHILAHMKIVHALLPEMIKKGAGAIINVSSMGAFLPSPKTATYSGTKAFLRAWTECLHMDLEGTGVQVQVVCPGLTKTDMHIRLGIPEEAVVDWGPFQWISPKTVVESSLRSLKKKKVVCIPDRSTKMQLFMRQITPESLYYKITGYFLRKYGWGDGNRS